MSLTITVGALIAIVVVVVLVAGASDRRANRRRAESAANRVLGADPGTTTDGRTPRALIALVAIAALLGAIDTGYLIAGRADQGDSERADQAQTNLSRCQSTVATGWRKGIAVLLIGYTAAGDNTEADDLPPELVDVAGELNLPESLAGIRAEGRRRLIAALLDDARISDVQDRICPYTPGDPAATPDEPVRSATAELERELAKLRDEMATTTSTPGG